MHYSIHEHRHRFASWAASRAASVRRCPFSVEVGKAILEEAGFKELISGTDKLPEKDKLDDEHRNWRQSVINVAKKRHGKDFTHGVAAKLINVYLKSAFVCGGFHEHPRVRALHPPIDRLLLDSLYRSHDRSLDTDIRRTLKSVRKIGWSNFNSSHYEDLIKGLREHHTEESFWMLEQHWRGYQ